MSIHARAAQTRHHTLRSYDLPTALGESLDPEMFARWVVAVVGLTHAWRHRPKRTLTPDRYPNNVMLFWLYQTGNISQFALDPHAVQVSAVAEALAGGD